MNNSHQQGTRSLAPYFPLIASTFVALAVGAYAVSSKQPVFVLIPPPGKSGSLTIGAAPQEPKSLEGDHQVEAEK